MFVHIGSSRNIPVSGILGIFDMDTATVAPQTKRFLSRAQRDGHIVNVSDELPKSFIVAQAPQRAFGDISILGRKKADVPSFVRSSETVYFCQLAPQTLAQRSQVSHREI